MNKNSNVSHGRKTFLCFSEILTDQPTNQPTDGYEGYTSKEKKNLNITFAHLQYG